MHNKITLFFLIDALGWEFIKGQSFLDGISKTKKPLKTVLGFSCSAIPSILTGIYPSEHGSWNLLYYSPESSPFSWTRYLHFLPDSALENRISRRIINIVSKKLSGSEGYFSSYGLAAKQLYMFDISEKSNIYRPGGINGNVSLFDFMVEKGVQYRSYSYHDFSDEESFGTLEKDLKSGNENVYFSYLAELDDFLHHHCHEKDFVSSKLLWYEKKIGNIIEIAKVCSDNVRWFVFSDHGMTPIVKHFNLIGSLSQDGINLKKDCLSVFDSTMARFWIRKNSVREKLLKSLNTCIDGKVLRKDELEELKVYFPDGRYGDIIFLMNPGVLISPNLFGRYVPKGMHGFHPDDRHSYGSYISSTDIYQPGHITDIFDIMKDESLLAKEG